MILNCETNPIRYQLGALGLREYLNALLNHHAPDESMQTAPWFQKISLEARMRYFVFGKWSDNALKAVFKQDYESFWNSFNNSRDALNKQDI
jgi:hypothetical protein